MRRGMLAMTKKPTLLKPSEFPDRFNEQIVVGAQEGPLPAKWAKLDWLAEHFGASRDNPDWKVVCLRLAETCLNGFQVSSRPARRRGRPLDLRKYMDLVEQVDKLTDSNGMTQLSVPAACARLIKKDPKRWVDSKGKKLEPKTLINHYWIWKPRFGDLLSGL
jgi:hypothetical protein